MQPAPPPQSRAIAKRPARPPRRRPPQQPRTPDDLRPGTPCLILLDCREGEPDRTGAAASFDGYFDFETGEPRRQGQGIPRLRIVRSGPVLQNDSDPGERGLRPSEAAGPTRAERAEPRSERGLTERVWGFEVWWRPDPQRAGLTDADREDLETTKRLLRGLVRDASRRPLMAPKAR